MENDIDLKNLEQKLKAENVNFKKNEYPISEEKIMTEISYTAGDINIKYVFDNEKVISTKYTTTIELGNSKYLVAKTHNQTEKEMNYIIQMFRKDVKSIDVVYVDGKYPLRDNLKITEETAKTLKKMLDNKIKIEKLDV